MLQISKEYKELLVKYCGDDKLIELINQVILDQHRLNELYYMKHNEYPGKRDLLNKLNLDLQTTRQALTSKIRQS